MSEITIEDLGLTDTAGYKNLIAIRDYTKKTRDLVNNFEKQIKNLTTQIEQQNLIIEQLQNQIVTVQTMIKI